MAKKQPPVIRENTPEEESAIQAAIATDPDTWEATGPLTRKKAGRPAGQNKTRVTIRLDNDLLDAVKGDDDKGWQTRLNDAARVGMGMAQAEKRTRAKSALTVSAKSKAQKSSSGRRITHGGFARKQTPSAQVKKSIA